MVEEGEGRRVWSGAGTVGEAAGEPTEGCCLHVTAAAVEEAGGGDGAEAGVLWREEGAEGVPPELQGGTAAAGEEPRPGIWRAEGEEERRGRLVTEVEEAEVLCCGEEEEGEEEAHRETEEVEELVSGAHSSQPQRLLSSR